MSRGGGGLCVIYIYIYLFIYIFIVFVRGTAYRFGRHLITSSSRGCFSGCAPATSTRHAFLAGDFLLVDGPLRETPECTEPGLLGCMDELTSTVRKLRIWRPQAPYRKPIFQAIVFCLFGYSSPLCHRGDGFARLASLRAQQNEEHHVDPGLANPSY